MGGLDGVVVVGAASGLSLFLNAVTDEWFSCATFILLWGFLLIRLGLLLFRQKKSLIFRGRPDAALILFWGVMYGYCLAALGYLGILREVPLYAAFAAILGIGMILLCLLQEKMGTEK